MGDNLGKYVVCDVTKCSGCKACELACFAGHNKEDNQVGMTVGTVEVEVAPRLYVIKINDEVSIPIQCKHCEDAPCLNICSKNAIKRVNGQVIIDRDRCIGCKDCMLACPFGAIDLKNVFIDKKPVLQSGGTDVAKAAIKCDLCINDPKGPACVRTCPNNALKLIDPELFKTEKNIAEAKALYEASLNKAKEGENGIH